MVRIFLVSINILIIDIGVAFISKILKGKIYTVFEDMFLVSCNTELFDSVFIWMNGHWFEIPP